MCFTVINKYFLPSGKIRYYTHPPETHTMSTHLSAEFVTEMSKEFSVEELLSDEHNTLKGEKAHHLVDLSLHRRKIIVLFPSLPKQNQGI